MASVTGGSWKAFNTARLYLHDGTLDLDSNTMKVTLHSSVFTPNASLMSVYASLTNELATLYGYTSGGASFTPTLTQNVAAVTFGTAGGTVSWTASGGTIQAKWAVLRSVGTLNGRVDPLIAYVDLDPLQTLGVSATTGQTLTVSWPSGVLTFTGA